MKTKKRIRKLEEAICVLFQHVLGPETVCGSCGKSVSREGWYEHPSLNIGGEQSPFILCARCQTEQEKKPHG